MSVQIKPYRELFQGSMASNGSLRSDRLTRLRGAAYEEFKKVGFPTRAFESWKYVDLEPILGSPFAVADEKTAEFSCPGEMIPYFLRDAVEHRLVFVNGRYSPKLSSAGILPHGVFLESLAENMDLLPNFLDPVLGSLTRKATNPFALINTFSFKDGAIVYVPKDTVVEEPVHLVFVESEDAKFSMASFPRVLAVIGENAKANLVVNFIGDSREGFFTNAVSEIVLKEGAELDYTYIHRGAEKGYEFLTNYFALDKQSVLRVLSFATGTETARVENRADLLGEGASVSLKGLSVLEKNCKVYHDATVNHRAPFCKSRQVYKNILTGKSKSEFSSLVYVHRDAQKTDSNQLNKNLLLSDEAECFSRPQLKIEADDVSCTHGATVGQLEKDELFYLRSRGLSKEEARFLLTYGFAEELVEEVEPLSLRGQLETLVRDCLAKVVFKELEKESDADHARF